MQCLEEGTQKLEEGDVQAAKVRPLHPFSLLPPSSSLNPLWRPQALYQRSVDIKRTASSLFNLGVTHYHLSTSRLPHPTATISDADRSRGVR